MALPSLGAFSPMRPVTFAGSNPLDKLSPELRASVAAFAENRSSERNLLIKILFPTQPGPAERERLNRLGFRVFGQIAVEKNYELLGHFPLSRLKALVQSDAVLSVTEAVGYEMYH